MAKRHTWLKVAAWRLLSLCAAGITAHIFLGPGMAAKSWSLTALLAVQMTAIHYVFERLWSRWVAPTDRTAEALSALAARSSFMLELCKDGQGWACVASDGEWVLGDTAEQALTRTLKGLNDG